MLEPKPITEIPRDLYNFIRGLLYNFIPKPTPQPQPSGGPSTVRIQSDPVIAYEPISLQLWKEEERQTQEPQPQTFLTPKLGTRGLEKFRRMHGL